LFSSPKAALESTLRRIALLRGKDRASADEQAEAAGLDALRRALQALVDDPFARSFSRYQKLLELLRSASFGWASDDANDRLVIFSERIETLGWLKERLAADLHLAPRQLAVLHGGMADTGQQTLVERFGRLDDPLRVLVCSDVASEGLNLHYFCHRLVHFDLPWSLMTFQQRNGRVDRYGQRRRPHIVYLFTKAETETFRGDLRILEILQRKDDQASHNLGDPSAFLNVYDPDREAEKVGGYMASGMTPEQVEAALDEAAAASGQGEGANEGDYLLTLFGGGAAAARPADSSLRHIDEPATLFDSEYHYATAALTQLNQGQTVCRWASADAERLISLTAPRDLQERLRQLPREVQAENDYYALTADARRMAEAIETARQASAEEATWPRLHYLVVAAPHRRMAGRSRAHAFRAPLRARAAERASSAWRTGVCANGPGAQPQGPARDNV
jgi:superfamily II DNA/RNA helicase